MPSPQIRLLLRRWIYGTLDTLLELFSRLNVNSLPVRNEVKDFVGMVTHATLMRRYQQELLGES